MRVPPPHTGGDARRHGRRHVPLRSWGGLPRLQHKATASNWWCWRENGALSRHEPTIAATSARAFIAAHKGAENQEPGNAVVALMQPCFAFQRDGKAWSWFPRRNGALKGLREL